MVAELAAADACRHLGWQVRAAGVLAGLGRLAISRRLPPLLWTLGTTGTVIGRCVGADRRREFHAWASALSLTPRPEIAGAGVTRLRAVAHRQDGLIDVILLADIHTNEEEG